MINGRRVAGSPSLGGGGTVNLNMIPFSAVYSIEIVSDGASAIYGSDAVAGVVNIILKRGYDGFKITGRSGDRDRDSGEEESLSMCSALAGQGSVTFGIEYVNDPIFDADRDFTKQIRRWRWRHHWICGNRRCFCEVINPGHPDRVDPAPACVPRCRLCDDSGTGFVGKML